MPAVPKGLPLCPEHSYFWAWEAQGSTHLAETIGKDEFVIGGHRFSFGQNFH